MSEVSRSAYAYDSSPTDTTIPLGVISPSSTEEVSAIMKICNDHKIPVVTQGAATNLSAGIQPNSDSLVMLVRNMDKVLELDEENLTITVQPGVVTVDIHSLVEAKSFLSPRPRFNENFNNWRKHCRKRRWTSWIKARNYKYKEEETMRKGLLLMLALLLSTLAVQFY